MIKAAGNTELCELLDVEPKAQCKVCLSYWDVGIVYCTCGHFLRNGTEENKTFVQYTMDSLSIPNYYIKKGRPHGNRYGKKPGDHEYFHREFAQEEMQEEEFLGYPRPVHSKNMFDVGRSEELCREMDKLANEDHMHHITAEEISVYRNNWWLRSNTVGFPQREALQSDLQQHHAYNPFSKESKDAIMAAGNTELCEIVDVEPKACLTYWDVGIVCCTCGHFLRDDTTENKKYIKSVLDLFSIHHYCIRKGRPHGHRYGKKEGDQEYHTANQLQKKCKKREFLSIHDRFIRDARFRKTMIEMGRIEEKIREMDKLANEDHTHHATEEELNVNTVAIGGYVRNLWVPTRCP